MREVVQSALRQLDLDYAITSISGGTSQDYEIVMWDKPGNSYFSIRVPWKTSLSREYTADCIVQQLTDRLAEWRTVRVRGQGKRRPHWYGTSQLMKVSSVGVD